MTSSDTFVSIDIETTGLDPNLHEIIEIGAVKIQDGDIIGEYSELVKPEKPVPEFITHLTGITNKDVKSAGSIWDVIPSLLDFIRGYRLVGQNVRFDVAFLRKAAGVGNITTALDNIELARILLPRLPSYSLDSLIDFFALTPEKRHRAYDDARITAVIFLKLIDMLRMMPGDNLNELYRIASKSGSVLEEVFEALVRERLESKRTAVETPIADIRIDKGAGDNIYGDFTSDSGFREPGKAFIDVEKIESLLKTGGELSKNHSSYEERSGQIMMAKRIAKAFNESEMLLAEAGTGTGKSIAYLIPAILWAEAARERVVISTNTKNLQEQLFSKDIPLLGTVLKSPFRAVILKGRGNYICLRRWGKLVESSEQFLSKQEWELMLPVAAWLQETRTGDLSETGFFNMLLERGLLERIKSESTSCMGAKCAYRDKCFVSRIRRAAQRSHVIIVNHSLVFSDMSSDGGVLGNYSRLIFDEAHNIEKVAMQFLGVNFSYYRIRRILNRLYDAKEGKYGILASLSKWAEEMVKGWPEFAANVSLIETSTDTVRHVRASTIELFENLNSAVRSEAGQKRNGHSGKLRFRENSNIFDRCADFIDEFASSITELIRILGDIFNLISGVTPNQLRDKEERLIDLEDIRQNLMSLNSDFAILIEATGKNVYWFEYSEKDSPFTLKINNAPLDVAEKLSAGLYDHMETVIMTSATLAVARDFSYIRERLGLNLDSRERTTEFIAASTFDYNRQSALVIPQFLPTPKQDSFIGESNEVILNIAHGVRRGMLVLFTSWGHLNRAYKDLHEQFSRSGITLLAQGIDGSRSLLLRRFQEEPSSVLFGTDSFWEGVDVPGHALEVVVISRLPFAVPTDPVVQAQMEEIERSGGDPFIEFSVPEAAIKLRQGAGRLIRHRSDRGVIIIMDKRVQTTRYGSLFKRSLPGSSLRAENVEMLVKGLQQWFER